VGYVGQLLTNWVAALKDRRESVRMSLPLVAYYWNGASPQAYQVKTVSEVGAYIVTPDRWYMGTVLRLTFQYNGTNNGECNGTMQALPSLGYDPERTQMVLAKLVRIDLDGVAVRLIYLNRRDHRNFKRFLAAVRARGN
jgi:hypothetical protein